MRVCLIFTTLMLGAAPPAVAAPTAPLAPSVARRAESGKPGALQVRMLLKTPSGELQLATGATLADGAQVRLVVQLTQAGYLYVFQFTDQQQVELLVPDKGEGRVAAGQPVRYPPREWVPLNPPANGIEHIFFIAAGSPLDTSYSALLDLVEQLSRRERQLRRKQQLTATEQPPSLDPVLKPMGHPAKDPAPAKPHPPLAEIEFQDFWFYHVPKSP